MKRVSPLSWCSCVVKQCHAERDIIDWQVGSQSSYSYSEPCHCPNVCLRVYCFSSWQKKKKTTRKNSKHNITRQVHMLSFKGRTLLFGETVTILRSIDKTDRKPALFWLMAHVTLTLIILVLKSIIFYSPSCPRCNVMVMVVGNGHGDTSSNPGRDWLDST